MVMPKICNQCFLALGLSDIKKSPLKVNRSQDMKQKIYETLISPKIKTNGIILNNCIDWVCLCFDRLLLLDLSEVQVLRTYYVTTF